MTGLILPKQVTVYEVGPRDGLQNEEDIVPTPTKVRFIDMLSAAGLPYIEATSFVRPQAIVQLGDAEQVIAAITRRPGTKYTALVPNTVGMQRAAEGRLDGIALFTSASETFNRKNVNASIGESIDRFRPVIAAARRESTWVRAYISVAFGCPYEGEVTVSAVKGVAAELNGLGVDQIVISDTIGVADPLQVGSLIDSLLDTVPLDRIGLHFHDTRGTALANVLAGLQCGITTIDAAAGGLGGCPYAPGASGNLATEDLLYLLHEMGIATGVSLDAVVAASRFLHLSTGRDPASRYYHAVEA